MSEEKTNTIVICMGSSCFSRGNRWNLNTIQEYLRQRGVEAQVELRGDLCQGECKKGPNLTINGIFFHEVAPAGLIPLLDQHLK